MENPIKMDDLGGKPTIFGNTHMKLEWNRFTTMPPISSHLFPLRMFGGFSPADKDRKGILTETLV